MSVPVRTEGPFTLRDGRNGGKLRSGNPGNKGSAGHAPEWWLKRLQDLATSPASIDHLEAAINAGPTKPEFWKALEFCADRGCGPVPKAIEMSSDPDNPMVLEIVVRREI